MRKNIPRLVMDSFSIIAYLNDEPAAGEVQKVFLGAKKGALTLFMNKINVGEVYYISLRRRGESEAEKIISWLKMCPLNIVEVDDELLFSAAKIKAKYPISYADAFALATSLKYQAPLLTGDPEFKKVEKLVRIRWLP